MAGTPAGGAKTAKTNKERYGEDFYKNIGSRGGKAPTTKPKGFAANPELAARVGRKAGKISKRNHEFIKQESGYNYYIAKDTGNVVKYKHEGRS